VHQLILSLRWASEMTCIVSGGALNSTHSLTEPNQSSGDSQYAINRPSIGYGARPITASKRRNDANDVSFLWRHSSWSRSWRLERAMSPLTLLWNNVPLWFRFDKCCLRVPVPCINSLTRWVVSEIGKPCKLARRGASELVTRWTRHRWRVHCRVFFTFVTSSLCDDFTLWRLHCD